MENGSMQSYRGTATFVIVEAPSKIALTRFSFQFPFPLYPPLKSEGVKKELYNKKRNVHCVSWLFKLLSVLNSRYFCNKIIILLLGNEKRSYQKECLVEKEDSTEMRKTSLFFLLSSFPFSFAFSFFFVFSFCFFLISPLNRTNSCKASRKKREKQEKRKEDEERKNFRRANGLISLSLSLFFSL